MNKTVSVFVTYNGTPQVNLSPVPTISIWNADTGTSDVNLTMSEVGGGFYKYVITNYDLDIEYLFVADAGPSFPDNERYYYGSTTEFDEVDAQIVTENLLNTPMNVTFPANSLGELLQGIDTSIGISIDLIHLLVKYQTNRTKINSTAKTLTVYDDDGTTPLKVFNLYDDNGILSIENVFERLPQ